MKEGHYEEIATKRQAYLQNLKSDMALAYQANDQAKLAHLHRKAKAMLLLLDIEALNLKKQLNRLSTTGE